MCSIVGSYDIEQIERLVNLNAYRGQKTHSLLEVLDQRIVRIWKGPGPLGHFDKYPDSYMIVHHQEPTTQSIDIHPAVIGDKLLYHNGIIKERYLDIIRKELDTDGQWDTKLLLQLIEERGLSCLSDVDGSFACVYINKGNVHVFRNTLAPLFIDDNATISSTQFDGSIELPPNVVSRIDNGMLTDVFNFSTNDDVYYYG